MSLKCRVSEAGRISALQDWRRLLLFQPLCLCAGYTQVSPAPRQVRHNAADGSLVASGTANTICLQLAGGWLPLEDVSGGWQLLQQHSAAVWVGSVHEVQAHSHRPASYKVQMFFSADGNVFVCVCRTCLTRTHAVLLLLCPQWMWWASTVMRRVSPSAARACP